MNLNRKWLVETPLAPTWRRRLELTLGTVVTSAAVVALGTTFRPTDAQLDRLHGVPPLVSRSFPEPAEELLPLGTEDMLEFAASKGDVARMRRAYAPGMKMDRALSGAARSGSLEAVRWVVARGADIHHDEIFEIAPILLADRYPDIVDFFHEHGVVDPSLDAAAGALAPQAVRRILAKDPHPPGLDTALASAASAGGGADKVLVIDALLAAGADPDAAHGGQTVLAGAIQTSAEGTLPILHALLEHGARVSGDAIGAALALDAATRRPVLDLLLANPIDRGTAAVALDTATDVPLDEVPRIIAGGVDWTYRDGEDDAARPVVAAARRGDRDLLRILLDARAPVDVHYKDGTSALENAIDGRTPAHARVVELLVERGANPNRRFPDGRTPLFAAAEAGDIRVVNFLIARGARLDEYVLDDTALDIAEKSENLPAARVIAAHGGRHGRRWTSVSDLVVP